MNEIFIRFPEGTSDYTPIMFGYHCGMRLGEAFAPVWEDIDFQNKILKLNQQIQWMSNSNRTENEKKMSNGTINPIDTKGNVEIHIINIREDGSYITPRTMQHTSNVIHKALNFPEFDFHSLRHTHSTMLAESGAPLVYIKKRLGHEKPEMTTQVYTNHLTPKIIVSAK